MTFFQAIDRGELKEFKKQLSQLVRRKKSQRKCGRHFLRYCDANNNREITVEEWVSCMDIDGKYSNTMYMYTHIYKTYCAKYRPPV